MLNIPPFLNQLTWGVHLNFEGYFTSPPTCPDWITPLQQQDWHRQAMVAWDANLYVVAHLYAGHELEILKHMRANNNWGKSGLVIGSPTFRLSIIRTTEQLNPKAERICTLENQIEPAPDQAQDLFEFLIKQEKAIVHISTRDKEDAQKTLENVYRLIAAYGRKIREGKQDAKLLEVYRKVVSPTTLPKGSYFTVSQAAQVCDAASKQIRAWIRRGKLEAIELPGLGLIIEAGKLNEFLYKRDS
jgi:hypothetical protein